MPNNKKPRKKYQPKPVAVLPSTVKLPPEVQTMLKLIPHTELEKLRDGTADEGTWHTITMRLDWGLVMAIDHFTDEPARQLIRDSLDAIVSVRERHNRTGKWGATGEEFHTIAQALVLVDDMQANTTRREQDQSLQTVFRLNQMMQK